MENETRAAYRSSLLALFPKMSEDDIVEFWEEGLTIPEVIQWVEFREEKEEKGYPYPITKAQ